MPTLTKVPFCSPSSDVRAQMSCSLLSSMKNIVVNYVHTVVAHSSRQVHQLHIDYHRFISRRMISCRTLASNTLEFKQDPPLDMALVSSNFASGESKIQIFQPDSKMALLPSPKRHRTDLGLETRMTMR